MVQFRIDVVVNPSSAVAGTKAVEQRLSGLNNRANLLRGALTRALAVFGGFALIRRTIRTISDFEQSLATVQAVTRATAQEMELFSTVAQELGRTTRFTATQAADALVLLSRAGFTVQESTTAVEGTLRLAQAAAIDLSTAADITASTLRGFRLDAAQTGEVIDVLALASSRANTTVTQLGEGLKFVAPVAAGLDISLQQTSAAMGVLSDAGLQATLAGTGLRRVLAELEAPSDATREILSDLGLTAEDVRVSQVGLTTALERLADAGIDTGAALRLFGQRGGPAFEVLSNNIPRIRALTETLQNANGVATEMANTMDDTLKGAAFRALSAIQGFILTLNNAIESSETLKTSLEGVADAFNFVSEALGSGLRAAEAERAFSPVGQQIVRIQREIKRITDIGKDQGFLSPSQEREIARLTAALDRIKEGHRQATIAAQERAKEEEELAKKRALAAEQASKTSERANPIQERIRELQEQNQLLTVELALGERAAQVREIELDLSREAGKLTESERQRIADLIDEHENLNDALERQAENRRKIIEQQEEEQRQAEREKARIDRLIQRLDLKDQERQRELDLEEVLRRRPDLIDEITQAQEELTLRSLESSTALEDGFARAFIKLRQEANDFASVGEAIIDRFADHATDALTEFLRKGEFDFDKFTAALLDDITRIIARLLVVQTLSALGGVALGPTIPPVAGGRQEGGTTQPGRSYVVGENGPELFIPDRTGTVVPAAASAPAPATPLNLQVVNVSSEDEVPQAIDTGGADESILNVFARNPERAREILGF